MELNSLINFQVKRHIINLNKKFLVILEEIAQNEHNIEKDYGKLRKKVLDAGNDSIRELEELINSFKVELK